VLFVDDEPQLLEGLRQRLQPLTDKWHMTFVDSGADALSRFERSPHDVIVSDISMPGMDGAQLLHVISERWPATIRIALSERSESEAKLRLLPLAHQYLSKPCRPEQLEDAVVRSLKLREELTHPGVQAIIGRIRRLPARPEVFARLQAVMASPDTSAREVARVKKFESGVITDPITVPPETTIRQVIELTRARGISGVPVASGSKVMGIVTHRDLRFERQLPRHLGAEHQRLRIERGGLRHLRVGAGVQRRRLQLWRLELRGLLLERRLRDLLEDKLR